MASGAVSSTGRIVIDAAVAEGERPVIEAVEGQLAECLAAATGAPWSIETRLHDDVAALASAGAPAGAPAVAIASLLPELPRTGESIAATQARWRDALSALAAHGRPAVICTIFRRVAQDPGVSHEAAAATRERIRRLDLAAAELSHDTGASVADVDRALAHVGARPLATDHRLGGPYAAEVAAWTIVDAMLDGPLDAVAEPEVLQRAQAHQGPLWEIDRLLHRRLRRHAR